MFLITVSSHPPVSNLLYNLCGKPFRDHPLWRILIPGPSWTSRRVLLGPKQRDISRRPGFRMKSCDMIAQRRAAQLPKKVPRYIFSHVQVCSRWSQFLRRRRSLTHQAASRVLYDTNTSNGPLILSGSEYIAIWKCDSFRPRPETSDRGPESAPMPYVTWPGSDVVRTCLRSWNKVPSSWENENRKSAHVWLYETPRAVNICLSASCEKLSLNQSHPTLRQLTYPSFEWRRARLVASNKGLGYQSKTRYDSTLHPRSWHLF